ncbi:hypothetical protein LOAG_06115 [Loa loa]|uniref:Uncharacterized protein n=1 Tax=Loa loa TaxID=7209 RepID=A0A1S0TZC9_LOALO|nr:hypothetical protein LOAG_06115 [Loa loa]EFO22371.2 hypothetical protein LOAG_06115 [Loa loa]
MTNTNETDDDKFMVTLSTDILQTVCEQMEEDDPDAGDDEPVRLVVWNTQVIPFTSNSMAEVISNVEVVDISTPSQSPSGTSDYLMIIPRYRRRAYSFPGENLPSSSTSSESYHSQ